MNNSINRLISLALAIVLSVNIFWITANAKENKNITGIWETDFIFSASDLGVNGKDIVFRCELTFKEDGSLASKWSAIELSSIKVYFHQMFVNAYYACGFGAGCTSIEEIESACVASTGKSVTEHVDAFLDGFDMNTIFCPADCEGTYEYGDKGSEVYLDIMLMGQNSNPTIPNSYVINENTLDISADSFGQPHYIMNCKLKKDLNEPVPPVTQPPVTVPPTTEFPATEPSFPDNMTDKG